MSSYLQLSPRLNSPRARFHPSIFASLFQISLVHSDSLVSSGWVLKPSGKLLQLQQQLNLELAQRGFEVDKRPFSPHLTLSRIKAPLNAEEQQRLQRILTIKDRQPSSPIKHVSQISVMKSELSRMGAKYTCLRNVDLGLTTS